MNIIEKCQAAADNGTFYALELRIKTFVGNPVRDRGTMPCAYISITELAIRHGMVLLASFAGSSGAGSYFAWSPSDNLIRYYHENKMGQYLDQGMSLPEIIEDLANPSGDFAPHYYAKAAIEQPDLLHAAQKRASGSFPVVQVSTAILVEREMFHFPIQELHLVEVLE